MITTIQLKDNVKNQLQLLKRENQTFEDVILFLLKERELVKQRNVELIKTESQMLKDINKEISIGLEFVEDVGGEKVEW